MDIAKDSDSEDLNYTTWYGSPIIAGASVTKPLKKEWKENTPTTISSMIYQQATSSKMSINEPHQKANLLAQLPKELHYKIQRMVETSTYWKFYILWDS